MSSCAVKKNTETVAQYRQRCGPRPLGQIMMSKENTMKLCQHDECAKVSETIYEKKDACYTKVKSRYDVWPSAYASGALVKCRKVGAKNWGNKSKKKNEVIKPSTHYGYYKVIKGKNIIQYRGSKSDVRRQLKKARKQDPKGKYQLIAGGGKVGSVFEEFGAPKGFLPSPSRKGVNENQCLCEACWKGYTKKGMKTMFGKKYPNCVKNESYDIWNEDGSFGYTMTGLVEAEYQGRKVKLGKPMQGDSKKFKVYVKNDKGNVVKVNFGQGGDAKGGTMRIRKSNPKARKSFRARHNCDNPGPRHKARYWSCKKW